QILYVPAGFPHTTDTVTPSSDAANADASGEGDPSVHLTIGIDTHIWGLNYATLRSYSIARSGRTDDVKAPLEKSLAEEDYWRLFTALPLGFVGERTVAGLTRW
ncbi:unnamed protein product, partial [Laminaria digitata]